ncbi:AMP-binding protein [Chitinophaga sp. Hz27]|uniref:AMP-binding protein n=1 Tax=Chitinophaga sp. Hz27 TaxID=3347169 RepID=UPI0035D84759
MQEAKNISSYLRRHALSHPDKYAFRYLEDGEEQELCCSYRDLLAQVEQLAALLRSQGLSGHPAMLLYPEGLPFIVAFLACQEAGVIAVPMFPPRSSRHMERVCHIIKDAGAAVILCSSAIVARVQAGLQTGMPDVQLQILATDNPNIYHQHSAPAAAPAPATDVAFIQYTSGSTGAPKGVVVSHGNLLHNQQLITETFAGNSESIIFSWLPFYHDMGLIGNILHTIYLGATCILMSPFHFMQRPWRWMKALSKYRVTHSGGPNFAFDLCVDRISSEDAATLDLTAWRVAFNGAEPVKANTLARFARHFAVAGFQKTSFYPCYGLAEATLLVAGIKQEPALRCVSVDREALNSGSVQLLADDDENALQLVASGCIPAGMEVKIIPATDTGDKAVGEILIAGDSVTRGYWKMPPQQVTAAIPGYLHTGDLGFIADGHLFVTGRKKEMLIIRGRNYYPYDMENCCAAAHPAIQQNAVVAVAVPVKGEEQLVLLMEIRKSFINNLSAGEVRTAVMNAVIEATGLAPADIVLVSPLSLPRTSSGKLQRNKCGILYQEGGFRSIGAETPATPAAGESLSVEFLEQVRADKSPALIITYLEKMFRDRLNNVQLSLHEEDELAAIGIDSLRAMEIMNTVNKDLHINLDATHLFRAGTVGGFADAVSTMLWVADAKPQDEEIQL